MANDGIAIRRATVEDLPALRSLWTMGGRPAAALEKRVTDFQVACGGDGSLLGTVGLRLSGKQGWVHHETFADPLQADVLRPKLWERLLKVAQNHGLVRVWVLGPEAFWNASAGFQPAPTETKCKLPAEFGLATEPWQALQLREDSEALVSIEKELEVFQETQRAETKALMERAKVYRVIAAVIALAFLLATLAFAAKMLKTQHESAPAPNPAPPAGTNTLQR